MARWAGRPRGPCSDVHVSLSFSSLNLTASSKSEGSPSQRLENAAKKPEDKKEVFRPLKPAVRIAQNPFYSFQARARAFFESRVVAKAAGLPVGPCRFEGL